MPKPPQGSLNNNSAVGEKGKISVWPRFNIDSQRQWDYLNRLKITLIIYPIIQIADILKLPEGRCKSKNICFD